MDAFDSTFAVFRGGIVAKSAVACLAKNCRLPEAVSGVLDGPFAWLTGPKSCKLASLSQVVEQKSAKKIKN